jgi:ribokinase
MKSKPTQPRIAVVGSLNIDWIAQMPHLPRPGETVISTRLIQRFGGKGANQAIAAARQGAQVSLIGCVGDDESGSAYLARLQKFGINTSGITVANKTFTGTATIAVEDSGENHIIVNPGANARLTAAHVRQQAALIAEAKVLLLQLETPVASVTEALRIAAQHHVPVVLNPSPIHPDFPWGKHPIHSLIVNEGEARAIFGKRALTSSTSWRKALEKYAINRVIITRGSAPTQAILQSGADLEIPTLRVNPIDTVGAGDSFAGAYAYCLANKQELPFCLRYANTAGALATLKPGAQEAIPSGAQIKARLK